MRRPSHRVLSFASTHARQLRLQRRNQPATPAGARALRRLGQGQHPRTMRLVENLDSVDCVRRIPVVARPATSTNSARAQARPVSRAEPAARRRAAAPPRLEPTSAIPGDPPDHTDAIAAFEALASDPAHADRRRPRPSSPPSTPPLTTTPNRRDGVLALRTATPLGLRQSGRRTQRASSAPHSLQSGNASSRGSPTPEKHAPSAPPLALRSSSAVATLLAAT